MHSLSWSKGGEKLASASADGSIRIWHMDKIATALSQNVNDKNGKVSGLTGTALSVELTGHGRNVNQVAWCPFNPNILASSSSDKTIKIWDTSLASNSSNANCCILTINTEIENLNLTWHPLKPVIAVGTKDDKVIIHQLIFSDKNDLKPSVIVIETLKFGSEVYELSWSADGIDLAVSLGSGNVEIYRQYKKFRSIKAHTADCYCVSFKGDDLLAIGSSDAQVTIWLRKQDYTCFRVFNIMEWPIRSISFSHDGEFLAISSEDHFIAIEHIKTGVLVSKLLTGKANIGAKAGIPINCVSWHPNKHILAFAGDEIDDRTGKSTGTVKLFGLC